MMFFTRDCRAHHLVLALVCLLIPSSLLAFQGSPSLSPSPGPFRIAGTIISSTSGTPLARARVTIGDTKNLQRRQWMITGDDGRFEFNQIAASKYSLQGAKKGFISAGYDEHEQFSTAIVTGAGMDTEHLIFRLAPSAVLTGRVLDESGEPVRRANVNLYSEDRRTGVSRIIRINSDVTDDRGSFEFAELDSSAYFLSVSATPWYALHPVAGRPEGAENVLTMVDRSLDVAYPMTFYANATESDEATPIPLRGGDRIQLDIHVNPAPALHLLFRVANSQGDAISMPQLQKRTFDTADWVQPGGTMQMLSPGLVEITGVAAGRYFVGNQNASGDSAPQSAEVELSENGQELQIPTSEPPASIKASVHVVGASQLPQQLMLVLRNAKQRPVAFQQVNPQGEVEFLDVAPGQYTLMAATANKPYSVLRMSSEGTALGHALNIQAGSSVTLAISLIGGEGNVEGFAKRDGKPVAGAMIVLVPKNPESNRELFRRDQSDLDGSFSLRSVIPGLYTVVAIENGWDLDWSEPGVIAHYCQHGREIQVSDRAEGPIHLDSAVEVQAK